MSKTHAGLPREQLRLAYMECIGYDPYLDDPDITDTEVAQTLDEWRDAQDAEDGVVSEPDYEAMTAQQLTEAINAFSWSDGEEEAAGQHLLRLQAIRDRKESGGS